MIRTRTLWWLVAAFALVWFANIDYRHLIKTDEGRYAEIAREMVASGDWVTPRLNDYKYLYKPPLQYWATATAFTWFGQNEWTARLWTTLTGFLGVLLVFFTGCKLWDRTHGFVAAIVLGGSLHWVAMGHMSSLDMGLAFAMTLAVCAFAIAQRDDAATAERHRWMLVAWAGAALAVLSKGLVGLVLPAATIAAYVLWQRDWRLLSRMHWLTGGALFLALTLPWFVLVSLRNPEFFDFFFIHEHFRRFLTKVHGRYQPWWYFIPILIAGTLPWALALPAMIRAGLRASAERFQPARWLFLWAAIVFVFFSLSSSKLPSYTVPVLPALALLAAHPLVAASNRALGWQWAPLAVLGIAIASYAPRLGRHSRPDLPAELLAGYAPWILAAGLLLAGGALAGIILANRGRRLAAIIATAAGGLLFAQCVITGHEALSPVFSSYHIARKIEPIARSGVPFFAVDTYDHTLPFYTRRTLTMVAYKDELATAIGWEPHKFLPDYAAFERAWAAAPQALALMAPREFEMFRARGLPMQLVARDPRRVIVQKP